MPRRMEIPRLSDEQRELAASALMLAYGIAWKYTRAYPWLKDEFESAAHLVLIRCAAAWDKTRGVAFTTYLYVSLHPELRRLRRRDAKRNMDRHAYLTNALPTCRRRGLDSWRPKPRQGSEHDPARWAQWMERLTPKQREACEAWLVRGEKLNECAERLGVSKQAVDQQRDSALRKLKWLASRGAIRLD